MKVKLLRDTIVRFPVGAEIEVSEEEGARLIAFLTAEKVEAEKPKAEKKTKGKK